MPGLILSPQSPAPAVHQQLQDSTFTPLPTDSSLTIDEIFEFHRAHSGNYPLFIFTSRSGTQNSLAWSSFVSAVRCNATQVLRDIGYPESGPALSNLSCTVAILANSDSISFAIVLFSILQAGLVPFAISPRNSSAAVRHLLDTAQAGLVYASQDEAIQCSLKEAVNNLPGRQINVLPIPSFEELMLKNDPELSSGQRVEPERPAMLLHSSGSTAFPKAITLTNAVLLRWGRYPYLEADFNGHVISLHGVPMFHGMGVAYILRAAFTGMKLAVFAPQVPPRAPAPNNVLHGIIQDQCTVLTCVPKFLETWSKDDDAMKALSKLYTVMTTGAPLSKASGDILVDAGVRLCSSYAGTETGCVTILQPHEPAGKDWQYLKLSPDFDARFISQTQEGVAELVVLETDRYKLSVVNTTIDGRPAYATRDLFVLHPTKSDHVKVFGRADEQIMLSSGEKTNPGPIEDIFCRDGRIVKAMMFGRGRFNNGIILQLRQDVEFNPADTQKLREFRNAISDVTQEANSFAPSHSKLYPEMVIVANPTKPLSLTAKGNIRRQEVLSIYAEEIQAAYDDFAKAGSVLTDDVTEPGSSVETIVRDVMGRDVDPDGDLFQQGCDSLSAIRIRNLLVSSLGENFQQIIPEDVVYRRPTLRSLQDLVDEVRNGSACMNHHGFDHGINDMERLVSSFSAAPSAERGSPSTKSSSSISSGDVILVTGTTGALGCHILSNLAAHPNVTRVYTFNRRHSHSHGPTILDRHLNAIKSHGIDPSLLSKKVMVHLEGDLNAENWAIDAQIFQQLRDEVTITIHAAWPVDFKYKLSTFTRSLSGLQNLIDFSLEGYGNSKASRKLIFISSLGMLRNWKTDNDCPEAPLEDPSVATGLGYTESKWVAERLLHKAVEKRGLNATIVRVGQLSGAENGCWKTSEWFPTLVKSARLVGCFPAFDRYISWVPVHIAGKSVVDVIHSEAQYLHLSHPSPVSSASIYEPLAALLDVPVVPTEKWLECLEALRHTSPVQESSSEAKERVLVLQEYFGAKDWTGGYAIMGSRPASVEKMLAHSPTLSDPDLGTLGAADAMRWLKYWRSINWV